MSHRLRVPTTLHRTVFSLLSSHQSTFGLPVTPAQLSTWVGLSRSSSSHRDSRFSIRTFERWNVWPFRSSRLQIIPPIQPRWPITRKTGAAPASGATGSATTFPWHCFFPVKGFVKMGWALSARFIESLFQWFACFVYQSIVILMPSPNCTVGFHPRR